MKFRPLHDRILVKRLEAEDKTKGGIIIPDNAKEKPTEGLVIAVGSGKRADDGTIHPLDIKPGDRIIYGKWSGTEIKIDGEELLILTETDVMGIVDDPQAAKKAA
jgi:chaperonin GroES